MAKTLFVLLLFVFVAYGQQERVAIIQTLDNRDSVGISDLAYLTDRLREVAVKVLPSSHYGVMTTESIIAFLGSQENAVKVCKEASCLAEIGRKVNADYVAQGRIGRFNKNFTIKVELYNTKSGIMMDSFTGDSKNIVGLLAIINEKAPALFKKMDKRLYSVNLTSEPTGADLSFDIDSFRCITPCRIELPAGNVHITAYLDEYGADTIISINQNNQRVHIKLQSNSGILEVKPAYSEGIGKDEQWSLSLNGQSFYSLENKLPPSKYKGELSHRCYEDISFNIGVGKGKRQVFDMAKQVKLKKGGLVLKSEKDGESVYVNGKQVGKTPFSGSVPLCAVIEIGKDREKVDVELEHNGRITHIVESADDSRDYRTSNGKIDISTEVEVERQQKQQTKEFFIDSRDGKRYKIIKAVHQTWMAENLNYNANGSKCYNNQKSYCQKYGRLYNWAMAKSVCPNGWHLPSQDEWNILIQSAGGFYKAGTFLKSTSGWNGNGNGIDIFDFSALPGGAVSSIGRFNSVGLAGGWWTVNEVNSYSAHGCLVVYDKEGAVCGGDFDKVQMISVRCLQD